MRIMAKVAALGLLMFTLFPAVAAQGQETECVDVDYCEPSTPDNGDVDANEDTDILPADTEADRADEAPVGGSAEAPSGSLPITGADVIGIAALGAAALGLGTVLVRRSGSMRAAKAE